MSTPKPATVPPPDPKNPWTSWVAITAACLAALAAVSSLLTERHTTEAMIDQISASDQWNFFQAKGIKLTLAEQRADQAAEDAKPVPANVAEKVERYKTEQADIRGKAEKYQGDANDHRRRAGIVANASTLAQISIAMAAISLLAKKKWFWMLAIFGGIGGAAFLAWGLISPGPVHF